MRFIYTFLFYWLTPFILARLFWRGRGEPAYRRRWNERFGWYRQQSKLDGAVWFHAVSVGEAEAAFPLIRAMARRFPGHPILVTTTTPTGSARVRAALAETVEHVYLPYDLPGCVARFMAQFRPVLAVVMETEIWPNLYHACKTRGIPLSIVNARLSERSAKGYARLGGLSRRTLSCVNLIAAQTQADASRFLSLGANPQTVKVAGNIKYDLVLPEDYFQKAAALRQELFGARKVFIAASTHDGEEAEILRVFKRLRQEYPELLLVLVPRHPPRFDKVAGLCLAEGLRLRRRSAGDKADDAEVFLVDTLGELRLFYAASDIAFVGGSLVPVGGHNVLEPALAGLPVLFGPYMFNFEEAGRKLREAGGAIQLACGDELAARVLELLKNESLREATGDKGRYFVESGRGALQRIEDCLAGLLGQTERERP